VCPNRIVAPHARCMRKTLRGFHVFVLINHALTRGLLAAGVPLDALPPLFSISARSLYEAGFQQGRLAGTRIKAWLASQEMSRLRVFAHGEGRAALEAMKRDNTAAFPKYVEELGGIAAGAGVDVDAVWCLNLISELENLMDARSLVHCSDVYAVSPGGSQDGFVLGHNEDWPGSEAPLVLGQVYCAACGALLECTGGLSHDELALPAAKQELRIGLCFRAASRDLWIPK